MASPVASHTCTFCTFIGKKTAMITWEDFEKIDIRTGTIIEVNDFPKARRPSYQLIINFGSLGIKRSSAQITHHYSKEELLNKQIVAVINFPPKQIATFFSECLVLGVYDENNNVVLIQPNKEVGNGQKIG
jgi:tRNA-binding protein